MVALQYVPSDLQVADFFTKAYTRAQHRFSLSPNSVLLIDLEFEKKGGGVTCIFRFYIPLFVKSFSAYLCVPVPVYIWAFCPQMNTGAIHNKPNIRICCY